MALLPDTSVLVKIFTGEPGAVGAIALWRRTPELHVGPLTELELTCALHRKARDGILRASDVAEVESGYARLLHAPLQPVPLTPALVRKAGMLVRAHGSAGLRTLDAIQLAACLDLPEPTMATADLRLRRAATRCGIRVIMIGPA